jgi:TPR repeat protein
MSVANSESGANEVKAMLAAFDMRSLPPGVNRFRLLRRALQIAMKTDMSKTGAVTDDPALWRMLGERELLRHEKYNMRCLEARTNDALKSQIARSFDLAVAYLGRAAKQGDAEALLSLGHLYLGTYSMSSRYMVESPAQKRVRPSKALYYFRKAAGAGSVDALYDIYTLLHGRGRDALALLFLRQAGRRGVVHR